MAGAMLCRCTDWEKGRPMRGLLLLAALIISAPAAAHEPEWRQASEYDVLLRPWAFEPRVIRLEAGRPVRLRFVNSGQATLTLRAKDFFRAARVRSGSDAEEVRDGAVELAPGERQTITLVPRAGRYAMRGANFFQRLLGMRGRIIVE